MRQIRKNQSGFTLVEMIIVIAIAAILAGIAGASFGAIRAGNAAKSASKFDSKLSTTQTTNMTKEGKTFLYVYQDSNGIQAVVVTADTANPDGFTTRNQVTSAVAAGNASATKIGGSKVSVSATGSGSSLTLNTSNMLKIGFDKATGAFTRSNLGAASDTTFYDEISFSGSEVFKVKLVKATGKHFVR